MTIPESHPADPIHPMQFIGLLLLSLATLLLELVLALILGMIFGFRVVLLLSALCYAGALFVAGWKAKASTEAPLTERVNAWVCAPEEYKAAWQNEARVW